MITKPLPFEDAIAFLLGKEQLPAEWDAAMWQDQEADFRNKAFWSSRVENARFLDRAQGLIFDYLAKVRENVTTPSGERTTALKVGGRGDFVLKMREFMMEEGMAKPHEFKDVDQNDVEDIRSMARLNLIFDTQVRSAYGYGQWKQGMTPAALAAFPAARLVRERGVKLPRPRHQANLGEVLLKTDPRWAEYHNGRDIGGFGVPWGPYGFNSGVTQRNVSRAEAVKLGLQVQDHPLKSGTGEKVTDGLQASVRKMDPAVKQRLLDELRKGPSTRDAISSAGAAAREAAQDVRREMLQRGLQDAIRRGDAAREQKYRQAFADLPNRGLRVVDRGDSISLEQ